MARTDKKLIGHHDLPLVFWGEGGKTIFAGSFVVVSTAFKASLFL